MLSLVDTGTSCWETGEVVTAHLDYLTFRAEKSKQFKVYVKDQDVPQ